MDKQAPRPPGGASPGTVRSPSRFSSPRAALSPVLTLGRRAPVSHAVEPWTPVVVDPPGLARGLARASAARCSRSPSTRPIRRASQNRILVSRETLLTCARSQAEPLKLLNGMPASSVDPSRLARKPTSETSGAYAGPVPGLPVPPAAFLQPASTDAGSASTWPYSPYSAYPYAAYPPHVHPPHGYAPYAPCPPPPASHSHATPSPFPPHYGSYPYYGPYPPPPPPPPHDGQPSPYSEASGQQRPPQSHMPASSRPFSTALEGDAPNGPPSSLGDRDSTGWSAVPAVLTIPPPAAHAPPSHSTTSSVTASASTSAPPPTTAAGSSAPEADDVLGEQVRRANTLLLANDPQWHDAQLAKRRAVAAARGADVSGDALREKQAQLAGDRFVKPLAPHTAAAHERTLRLLTSYLAEVRKISPAEAAERYLCIGGETLSKGAVCPRVSRRVRRHSRRL